MKNGLFAALLFCLFFPSLSQNSQAQSRSIRNEDLIQFSGVVVSSDSLMPIPFTSVIIRNARRGTVTDYYGFFSFVAMKGDTIDFQYTGFKTASYILPDTLKNHHYSIIQVLVLDTIELREMVVHPWPSRDEFRRSFSELSLPDSDIRRARRNFELAQTREVQEQVPYDGSINFKYAQVQRQTQLYTAGQFPSISVLNPLAWASFIQAWKDGAFRKKEDR
ncbi:MAG: carboxypeptidase-like regulatory domain-containing protein [Sphingobacteriales bacterium]|jgi:hypothetical protein|nr:carboxypeptidase-like regulatory domain-containing protein [Sphingobacteriales bacterium]